MATASAISLSPDAVAQLARRVLGEPNRRLSTSRDLRFGRQGSLSVIPARGVFFDNESGVSGGVLDLMVHAGAAPTRACAAAMLRQGGDLPQPETDTQRAERKLSEAQDRARRVLVAATIWNKAQPLAGTPAERYLRRARKVTAPLDLAALRFAPAAPVYPNDETSRTRPALVAAILNGRGRLTGAHLTFLNADGTAKAPITLPRKMIGLAGGGRAQLIPGRRLVIAEGIESTASAWSAALRAGAVQEDLGACAGLSAGGVARMEIPADVRELIIAPDNDPTGVGERSARELAHRASGSGLAISFLPPPAHCRDWNDAQQRGEL